jgi:predicted lipoprotein with Yx(FWY)xxD motif
VRRPRVIVPATLAVAAAYAATGYAAIGPASAAPGAPRADAARSHHATVKTRHGRLGTFLVDGRGRTLYLFEKDSRGRSRCFRACAQAWPPLTTRERPEAEHGAKQSRLGTIRRGHTRQVTYAGHPLYRYAFDSGPGSTNGEGSTAFGARWFVLSRTGHAIR